MSKKKHHQLSLVKLPARNLRQPSKPIKFPLSPTFNRLVEEMIRVCRKHDGIGLAGPQVGLNIKIAIINLEDYGLKPFPLINPKIVKKSKKSIVAEEGCLSIPSKFHEVKRPEKIDVKTYDLKGKPMEFKADGLLARVIQHEVDHLEGRLYVDHLPKKVREDLIEEFYRN